MFDIDLKNVKKGKKFFCISLFVGILFLFIMGGILTFNYIKLNSLDSKILSRSVDVNSYINDEGDTMYSPIYYYEVDGINYSCKSSFSSSQIPNSQNEFVYYDSLDPANCMTKYPNSINSILLIFLVLPLSFIAFSIYKIIKINKRVKEIMKLNENGKLIKNLPYRLENTGMILFNVPIQRPVIDYILPNGDIITLYGDPRHDKKDYDNDGMVDIIIDENNLKNYYIDFKINRLTGNLPQDYYQPINQSKTINIVNEKLDD